MSYTEGYDNNFSSSKIPYDDIPITRRAPKGKRHKRVSVSSFKFLAIVVAVMFLVNIGLCIGFISHARKAVVKEVYVNYNDISAVGNDAALRAADTAWWSSVCVAAGGSCFDENSFYKNTASRGSGVIYKIDEQKNAVYFITCYHVIDGHDKYYVMLPSQIIPLEAKLVGYSSHYDLAVLKISDTSKLDSATAIQVYDSSNLAIAEHVFAVGNSLSGGLSVTGGLISKINTMIKVEGNTFLSREIQIDAAINPGNSGGGAFNAEGKFIGLVNAKLNATQSGNSTITVTGTAYAIPSNLVISIADSIIKNNSSPTCVNLGAEFSHSGSYGVDKTELDNGKWINGYRVIVEGTNSGSIASGKLEKDDHILSVKYTDLNGKEHKIEVHNKYFFEDIKFAIKPHSIVAFEVDRKFSGKTQVLITASSFSTY